MDRLQLPARLETALDLLPAVGCLADIGCDHGYLSIAAVQSGKAQSAIAADVNEGPLDAARHNIRAYGLDARIETRRSNGFSAFRAGEADAAVICGMGGMLIREILLQCDPVVRKGLQTLILQPQTEPDAVRRTLHALSFCIREERFVEDRGKYYVLFRAGQGEEQYASDLEYRYGRKLFEAADPLYGQWLDRRAEQLRTWAGLSQDPAASARLLAEAEWIHLRKEK